MPTDRAAAPRVAQLDFELFREDFDLVERVSARARHIRIEIRPGRRVVLVYPRWVPRSEALGFLRERDGWVRDKLAELERLPAAHSPPTAAWDGSDRVPLRGVTLPVVVEPARLRRAAVRFETQRIVLLVPPEQRAQPARLAASLRAALIHQARLDALRLLDAEAPRLGVRYSALKIHDPQTLWGSCNPGAVICLSWRLLLAPPEVLRYVVVHELCHLVHLDHSPRFWALVARQMPDYAMHKQWLREQGHQLHQVLPRPRAT